MSYPIKNDGQIWGTCATCGCPLTNEKEGEGFFFTEIKNKKKPICKNCWANAEDVKMRRGVK